MRELYEFARPVLGFVCDVLLLSIVFVCAVGMAARIRDRQDRERDAVVVELALIVIAATALAAYVR